MEKANYCPFSLQMSVLRGRLYKIPWAPWILFLHRITFFLDFLQSIRRSTVRTFQQRNKYVVSILHHFVQIWFWLQNSRAHNPNIKKSLLVVSRRQNCFQDLPPYFRDQGSSKIGSALITRSNLMPLHQYMNPRSAYQQQLNIPKRFGERAFCFAKVQTGLKFLMHRRYFPALFSKCWPVLKSFKRFNCAKHDALKIAERCWNH